MAPDQDFPITGPLGQLPQATTSGLHIAGKTWTNSLSLPVPKRPIRRILCLKLDHIGDMLVADRALRLLRKYFPDAHITLLCGPWNVGLATRLAIADRVIGISLLHAAGAAQDDEQIAADLRKRGEEELIKLNLGEFDLAIDLRIDEDTRDLLKLFDAKIYAGSGNLSKFPYLDVSLPVPDFNLNSGQHTFRLVPQDFVSGSGFEIGSAGIGFTNPVTVVDLQLAITGAKAPLQCGTSSDDDRLLGVGIEEVRISGVADFGSARDVRLITRERFGRQSKANGFLVAGWSVPEVWGTWSIGNLATLSIPVSSNTTEFETLRVELRFRAHVNEGNQSLELAVTELNSGQLVAKRCWFPDHGIVIQMDVPAVRRWGTARSRPFTLKAGLYEVAVETYRPDIKSAHKLFIGVTGTSPQRRVIYDEFDIVPTQPAQARFHTKFRVIDPTEKLIIEVGPRTINSDSGIFVISVFGAASFVAPPKVPAAHMEQRISQLVLATALEFSPEFERIDAIAQSALTEIVENDAATLALKEVEEIRSIRNGKNHILLGIGLGATKETKRWPFSYFLEFCELLLSEPAVILVLCGGPAEIKETLAAERALNKGERIINTCGVLALQSFGVMVGMLDLYIGYDTGTTHYAGRSGVRTVGLFAASHNPREWGPIGPIATWITHYTACSPCYLARLADCRFGHACMLDLKPAACWELISPIIATVQQEKFSQHMPAAPSTSQMMMCPPVRPALAEKAFPIGHPTSAESFGSPATTQAQDVTLLRWEDPNADAARLRQVVPLNSALLYGGWLDLETDPYVCRWLGPDGAIINPEPDLTIEEVRLRITSVYGADKPLLSATFAGHGKEASVTVKSAYGADRPVLDCSFVELRSEAPANTASRPSAMLPLLHLSLRDVGLDVAALVSSEPPPEGNGWIVRLMPRLLSRRFGSIHLKPFVSELRQRSATTWNEEHRCMCLSGITFIYASHLSAGTSKQEIMDRN